MEDLFTILSVKLRVKAPTEWDDKKGQEISEKLGTYFIYLESLVENELKEIDPELKLDSDF